MILDIETDNDMNIDNHMGYYILPTPYWLFPIGCSLLAFQLVS